MGFADKNCTENTRLRLEVARLQLREDLRGYTLRDIRNRDETVLQS